MAPRGTFPDIYGVETSALPDIKGPLNIDAEGDHVPANDMQEIPSGPCADPMRFVEDIEPQGRSRR
jgi:hypothetical protein